MSKLGINLKIDVTKLDKSRFFEGKNGAKYADLTIFVDPDEAGQYGDHGGIQIARKKDEPKEKQMPYVGNGTVFWRADGKPIAGKEEQKQGGWANNKSQEPDTGANDFEDCDIPF